MGYSCVASTTYTHTHRSSTLSLQSSLAVPPQQYSQVFIIVPVLHFIFYFIIACIFITYFESCSVISEAQVLQYPNLEFLQNQKRGQNTNINFPTIQCSLWSLTASVEHVRATRTLVYVYKERWRKLQHTSVSLY